ncbi:MAG: serine hydrolase [Trueperaceae bacterium]
MDIRRLEAFVFEKMAASRLPGLSLALVRNDELIHARGFGQRDLKHGLPATPSTLYCIGSVTKSFTALAIMRLAERGLLDPSDPVDRYLPFPFRPKGGIVRLEHLLAHTSGIPALAYSEAVIGHANGTGSRWLPISGPEDVLTFMDGAEDWEESSPGERWAYANEGYAMLGLIIERVSGKSYQDYLRDEILVPLGMDRTFLARTDVEAADDVAVPYVLPHDGPPVPGHYLYRLIRSEGGLISSVLDLAGYLSMYLRYGALVDGRQLVSPESIAAMVRPRVETPFRTAPELTGAGGGAGGGEAAQHYGFGLASEQLLGRRLVGHGGSVLVSTAHLAFLPEEGLGVAVLANGSGYPLAQLARAVLAIALGSEPGELPTIRLQDELARLTGDYETFKGTVRATVERHGDFLKLRFPSRTNPDEVTLVPEGVSGGEARFFTLSEGRRLPVLFRRTDDGTELLYERHKFRRTGAGAAGQRFG